MYMPTNMSHSCVALILSGADYEALIKVDDGLDDLIFSPNLRYRNLLDSYFQDIITPTLLSGDVNKFNVESWSR